MKHRLDIMGDRKIFKLKKEQNKSNMQFKLNDILMGSHENISVLKPKESK